MGKYLVIIRYLISTICVVTLLWGCDRTVDATVTPKVVRKKVIVQEEKTAKVGSGYQTVGTLQTAPAIRPVKKTAAVKLDKKKARTETQPIPRKGTDGRTVIAKKIEAPPKNVSTPKPLPRKKPAVRPRSEISGIQQPVPSGPPVPGDNLVAATSKVTPTVKPEAEALPDAYVALGKIDPFEPLFKEEPVAKKEKRKKRKPMTPLERIDLSQLKLVGIIMASSGNRALVEESSGKGYVIKKGTYIGINSGKVLKIVKEKVVVEEEFEDVFGKTKLRQREITLPKPPGEF